MADSTSPLRESARALPQGRLPAHALRVLAPRAALALGLLSLAGASAGLAVAFATVITPVSFLAANSAQPQDRAWLTVGVLVGGLVGLLAGLIPLRRGHVAVDALCRRADLLSPMCLAALVISLLGYRAWDHNRLTFLVLLAVSVLAAEHLFARCFTAVPPYVGEAVAGLRLPLAWRRHAPTLIVVLGACAYAAYFSHYTLLNHRRFGTSGFDLGINVNWCYNALHGYPFRTTVLFGPDGGSMIAGHAIFAVFLWLPFYALAPGAESLLVYQSVAVGIAAVPLYLFARTQISRWSAATVALAYLLYAPLHGANFYDYHELPVALPWHFLLYWLIASNRLRWASLVVVVIWAHREDLAVGVALLGLFLVLSGARPRYGAGLFMVSTAWFVIDKFVIMPAAGTWWFASIYKDLMPDGKGGYGGIVQTILINPAYFVSTLLKQDKLVYLLHMVAPLALLPVRWPLLALLMLPGLFFALMTTGYAPTLSIAFQYTTHWIPYAFAAVVLGLRLLGDRSAVRQRAALCAVVLGVAAHSVVFGALFQHETFTGGFSRIQFVMTKPEQQTYSRFKRLAARIPREASLAASETIVPHVAVRLNVYTLKAQHGDAEYLLIRKGDMNRGVVEQAFARNRYGLVDSFDKTFFLFKKGHESTATSAALRDLKIRLKPAKAARR